MNQTLKIINKAFKLRKCKHKEVKQRSRPCINFQIGVCLGPCCNDVDRDQYHEIVKEVILFLKGRTPELLNNIQSQMQTAAQRQKYELASVLRDKMFAVKKTLEKQVAVTNDLIDRDVIAVKESPDLTVLTLLIVRGGYLLGTRHFSFEETLSSTDDIIREILNQYYEKTSFIPKEILISLPIQDNEFIEETILSKKGKRPKIIYPQRGDKATLIDMAKTNAENYLKEKIASDTAHLEKLKRLQKKLEMKKLPNRIECFDNSNLAGREPVSGMVVFEKGKPLKSDYRKYKIQTVSAQDDYAYMEEVLTRRYGKGNEDIPYPELVLMDGGKGQLNIGIRILKDLDLDTKISIAGIAKKDEKKGETEDKVFIPGRVNPIHFGREGDLLLLLQRIRDEAHRYALMYHRKRRSDTAFQSILDTIPGIGEKRKKTLFKHFGSIDKIQNASTTELSCLPGMNIKIAKELKQRLSENNST